MKSGILFEIVKYIINALKSDYIKWIILIAYVMNWYFYLNYIIKTFRNNKLGRILYSH